MEWRKNRGLKEHIETKVGDHIQFANVGE